MIYVWLPRSLYQTSAGPQQRPARLRAASEAAPLQEGHRPRWMRGGSRCEPGERNLHALMRPHSLFYHPRKWRMCVCAKGEREYIWAGVSAAHMCSVCVCGCVCMRQERTGGLGVYFYSCYILWHQRNSTCRSVQTMWLTQQCSPQPQLHFLKPAAWLYESR